MLIDKVLYHLEVHHVEAHFTLEEAQELVAVEAYELPPRGSHRSQ